VISLRLLGPVEATVDGGPAPPELLWRKHLALLAYLALAPDRRAGREQLTGLMWGDKPESSAKHSLAEALRIIRKSTDEGIEDAGAGSIRLSDAAVDVDTDRFTALVEAGDHRDAAHLVVGELMDGFALADAWEYEEWLAAQRRTWRGRSEAALVAAAEEALAEGSPDAALELASRALALAPSSDVACQVAMRSHCLRGDRARALDVYSAFSTWLDDALGVLPSDETEALAGRVRAQRTWRLPDRAVGEVSGAESRRAPLVGRREELASLVAQWQECRRDRSPRVALIVGDTGTGRSRLLHEVADRAGLDGADIAVVRALPGDRDTDGAVLEALARSAGFDPAARGLDLADGIRGEDDPPLVLAVDDADWGDEASLQELHGLAARASDAPVLLVLVSGRAADSAALERLASDLGEDLPGVVVRPGPLRSGAIRELAAWAFPDYDEPALERLARRVAMDTAGYPLLAVDLLHAVAHGLDLADQPAGWPVPGRTLDQTRPGDLPETLVASVRVGFRVLTPEAQKVMAAVAVLDPPTPQDRIAAATGLEGPGLDSALDELEWERWLVADDRGYGFVAPLVKEIVARDMVTAGQRQRIRDADRPSE
jgi:DNA-binding SARP family transcriptional activator